MKRQTIPSVLNYLCLKFYLETIKCLSQIMKDKEIDIMVQLLQKHGSMYTRDIRYKWKLLHRGSKHGFDRNVIIAQCKSRTSG